MKSKKYFGQTAEYLIERYRHKKAKEEIARLKGMLELIEYDVLSKKYKLKGVIE